MCRCRRSVYSFKSHITVQRIVWHRYRVVSWVRVHTYTGCVSAPCVRRSRQKMKPYRPTWWNREWRLAATWSGYTLYAHNRYELRQPRVAYCVCVLTRGLMQPDARERLTLSLRKYMTDGATTPIVGRATYEAARIFRRPVHGVVSASRYSRCPCELWYVRVSEHTARCVRRPRRSLRSTVAKAF